MRVLLFAVVVGALSGIAAPLTAQVRPPADTVTTESDTTRVDIPPGELPADTFLVPPAQDTVPADSLIPAPGFPVVPAPPAEGWSAGVWIFDREALLRFHGLTLLELLSRMIPGLVIVRGGGDGAPVGISAFGLGGGRLRVFRDGWELDPLGEGAVDLQRVALADLERVRVERRLGEVRVELSPYRLATREPRSRFEAATGDFDTRVLRALFATPVGERSALTVAADIVDTDGWLRREPFTANTVVARALRAFGPNTTVGIEYRTSKLDRGGTRFPLSLDRREVLLRGRSRLGESLLVDGVLGVTETTTPGVPAVRAEAQGYQASARAVWAGPALWSETGARLRFGTENVLTAPLLELFTGAEFRPAAWLSAGGTVRAAQAGGELGTELEGRVRAAPISGVGLFAEAATGRRTAGLPLDTVASGAFADPSSLIANMVGLRAGAEWTPWSATLGVAALSLDPDRIAPFGVPFEPDSLVISGERQVGGEGYVSLPLGQVPVRFTGSYVRWTQGAARPYLPVDQGRASLVFHDQYYGGQLEPDVRIDLRYRGTSTAFGPDGALGTTDRYGLVDVAVQIRIIDVRAFVTFENVFNYQLATDIPELRLPGPRAIYGARWDFRN